MSDDDRSFLTSTTPGSGDSSTRKLLAPWLRSPKYLDSPSGSQAAQNGSPQISQRIVPRSNVDADRSAGKPGTPAGDFRVVTERDRAAGRAGAPYPPIWTALEFGLSAVVGAHNAQICAATINGLLRRPDWSTGWRLCDRRHIHPY